MNYDEDMTLTQLSYILAVDQHRHFGLAAESCFVTQPTLSMQIQKLEEELGTTIFDRGKQPVEPTDLGRLILAQARIVVGEAKKLEQLVSSHRDQVEGTLRLGVIPTLAPSILPLFIGQLAEKYPQLDITVEELQTHQIVERLKADSLDLGILVTPLASPPIIEHPLFHEPFLLYCAPGHPLLKTKKVSEKDLSTKEVWLLNEGHCFRDQVLSLCSDPKRGRNHEGHKLKFESGNLETLKKMVDQGTGYTLLPLLAAEDIQDEGKRKRLREFASPVPTREVSLVHHRLYTRQAIVQAVMTEIRLRLPAQVTRLKTGSFHTVEMKPI
ncbi:MAG: LysR substrate-binding domain-containing protein [Bdellovibrionaceae bacterium]|nr:LysR substrate-binding domain-containing protein [Pseudobdellovibrionaceae bacterium]